MHGLKIKRWRSKVTFLSADTQFVLLFLLQRRSLEGFCKTRLWLKTGFDRDLYKVCEPNTSRRVVFVLIHMLQTVMVSDLFVLLSSRESLSLVKQSLYQLRN